MLIKIYLINPVNPRTEKKNGKLAADFAWPPHRLHLSQIQNGVHAKMEGPFTMAHIPYHRHVYGRKMSIFCKIFTSISMRNAHFQKQEPKGLVFTGLYCTPIN